MGSWLFNRYGHPNATRVYFGGKSHSRQRLVIRDNSRRKRKVEIVSVSTCVLSINVRLNVVSTNVEEKGKDREKEKAGGRPAKLIEKKGDRDLEREIKNKGDIFC